ncbi:tumor necrosis factor receptor superfamily member 16-like [Polyodon spathula]|nr:tumor necrosis factor receptor superfamily member 16-like [Polyodon spathula]
MEFVIYLFVLLLGAVGVLTAQEPCDSQQYTASGQCCEVCQPGEGMVKKCGEQQTVCAPCIDSESFSENYSPTETCRPCTQCKGLLRMKAPCTESADAICVCDYGYYMDKATGVCQACTLCPLGHGVWRECTEEMDTVCELCPEGTYSDQESSMDPCLPCTICEDEEYEMESCTLTSDSLCKELNPRFFTSTPTMDMTDSTLGGGIPKITPPTDTVTTTNPSSTRMGGVGMDQNLIPIYCSILAAVVLGLVAFIVFKKWNSCKQNKQGANNRTVNQTPSPEGEKLHSDSGISVDSQSLQEQQQQQQQQSLSQPPVVKVDGNLFTILPPHKQEEVENLLAEKSAEEDMDWCSLAGLLGYQEEHIDTFRQEEHPVKALLSDWGSKDCATLDALCTALRKIKRDDIAESLSPEPTATSAV